MAVNTPFGGLLTFGSYWASPQVNPVLLFPNSCGPISGYKPDWAPTWQPSTGGQYPLDPYGFGPSPLGNAPATWPYLLVAAAGETARTAYADVESQWQTIKAWRDGSYTLSDGYSITACSGEVGWLTVRQANQTDRRRIWARLAPLPAKLKPGYNTLHYVLPLTFQLLGTWVMG